MKTFNCNNCGIEVTRNNSAKFCIPCSIKLTKEQGKKRKSTKEYKEWHKEYNKRPHVREYLLRYGRSEKRKEQRKKYYTTKEGKLVRKKSKYKRRHKEKQIEHLFSAEEWDKKVKDTKGICPMCNKFIGESKMTLDHIIPINKAKIVFKYNIDDVQPLCLSCNCSKRDTMGVGRGRLQNF